MLIPSRSLTGVPSSPGALLWEALLLRGGMVCVCVMKMKISLQEGRIQGVVIKWFIQCVATFNSGES